MIPVENYVACDLVREVLLYVKTMLMQHFRFNSSTDIFILLSIKKNFPSNIINLLVSLFIN